MQQEYIPYAHSIMDSLELAAVTTPGKARIMPDNDFEQVIPNDINMASNMVLHHTHFYKGYTICTHSTLLNTCPESPKFSCVLLRTDKHATDRVAKVIRQAKWASRAALTPTRLVFKEKTD